MAERSFFKTLFVRLLRRFARPPLAPITNRLKKPKPIEAKSGHLISWFYFCSWVKWFMYCVSKASFHRNRCVLMLYEVTYIFYITLHFFRHLLLWCRETTWIRVYCKSTNINIVYLIIHLKDLHYFSFVQICLKYPIPNFLIWLFHLNKL